MGGSDVATCWSLRDSVDTEVAKLASCLQNQGVYCCIASFLVRGHPKELLPASGEGSQCSDPESPVASCPF